MRQPDDTAGVIESTEHRTVCFHSQDAKTIEKDNRKSCLFPVLWTSDYRLDC